MKIKAAIMALLVGASMSYAAIDISVATASTWGVDDPLVGGVTFDLPAGALYQLIWQPLASGGVPSAIDPLNPAVPTGASELVLGSWFTSMTGTLDVNTVNGDSALLGFPNDYLVSGYVWTRVFNVAAPGVGDYYGDGGITGGPLNDISQANPPGSNTSDVAPNLDDTPNTFVLSNQIMVPEPSVLAFMGIGAALVAVRRFRRA